MEEINLQLHQKLKNDFQKSKNELSVLFQQFDDDYNEYINNHHFQLFEKQQYQKASKNLKNSETIFDKNYETILRNKLLIDEIEMIQDFWKELIETIEFIKERIEKDDDILSTYNNLLIEEMKEFEEEEVQETNKKNDKKYRYSMSYCYDQFKVQSYFEQKEQEEIKRKEKDELKKKEDDERNDFNQLLKEHELNGKVNQEIFNNPKNIISSKNGIPILKLDSINLKMTNLNNYIVSNKNKLIFTKNSSDVAIPVNE